MTCFGCDVSTTERTKPNWAGALLRCGILMPPMSALGHFRQIGTVATLRGCLLRPESGHWELSTRLRGTKVGSKVAAEFFWRGGGGGSSHFLSSRPQPPGGGPQPHNHPSPLRHSPHPSPTP